MRSGLLHFFVPPPKNDFEVERQGHVLRLLYYAQFFAWLAAYALVVESFTSEG